MARRVSPEELLKAAFWNQMERVYTSMPAVVVQVNNSLNELRVDIQPCIDVLWPDGSTEPRATIKNIPVIFPATSTSALTMPISVGDTVACFFSMRAMEIFNEGDGKPSPPNNFAKFDKKDAYVVPGLFTKQGSINNPSNRTLTHDTKDLVLAHNIGTPNEVEVRLTPSGSVIINCKTAVINATDSLEVNSPSTTWNGDMEFNGNNTMNGTFTLDGINVNDHTHPQVNDSGGDTEQPTGTMQ